MPNVITAPVPSPRSILDEDSRRWLHDLRASGHVRDDAVRRLHELLLRAARFEVSRRRHMFAHLRGGDHDDLAQQAADDALVAVLGKPELTCEECFDHLDRYVDIALVGADADRAVPGMRAHLIACPACAEDHDSLLEYVSHADSDRSPAA